MSNIAPPALVVGAPRVPLPFGLFSVVAPREGSSDRWEAGVEFESLGCLPAGGGSIGPLDCEAEAIPGLPKEFEGGLSLGDAQPFLVYDSYVCSPIGNPLSHAEDVAKARLEAREEARVASQLWAIFAADTVRTDYGELSSVKLAIATLELHIAQMFGSQGILHMNHLTASLAVKDGGLEVKGNRMFTSLGTPVIVGATYGSEGIYATPALFGYRSEVITSSNRAGDLLDRGTNDLYGVAERHWLLGYDPCGVAFASFPLEDPAPAPGPAGASAYEVAVNNGFEGTEVEWLASLQGTDGTDGVVQSVVAGEGIAVDDTDPANPIIASA